MRNAEIISHINGRLVEELRRAGVDIAPLSLAELEAAYRETRMPTLKYDEAVTSVVAISPRHQPKMPEQGLPELTPEDESFIVGEDYDIREILTSFEMYIASSCKPHATDRDLAAEEEELDRIPARLRPGGSRQERNRAEEDLAAAFTNPDAEPNDARRILAESFVQRVAERFVPADFVPQGATPEEAAAERALAGWGALNKSRNALVLNALALGVTKTRIHELTGMSRATIDRIPGVQ